MLNLNAVLAADAREAGAVLSRRVLVFAAAYSAEDRLPRTGDKGNGISERIGSQAEWAEHVKTDGCESCHQLGDKATREIPKGLGAFDSSYAAWDRRIQSGQVGSAMNTSASQIGRKRLLTEYADSTDRIKAGELPPAPATAARKRTKCGNHDLGLVGPQGIISTTRFRWIAGIPQRIQTD